VQSAKCKVWENVLATEINVILGDNKAYCVDFLTVYKRLQGVGQYRLISEKKILLS